MSTRPFTLLLRQGEDDLLVVTSNGLGTFEIVGSRLRAAEYGVGLGSPGYSTEDDSHVLGLVAQQLGALLSVEIIRRALDRRGVRDVTLVRFVSDDVMAAWAKGDVAEDLGPESPGLPLRLLRLERTGETLSLTDPYSRGLIEPIEPKT